MKKQFLLLILIFSAAIQLFAQDISISGTVTSADGLPLPGVNVFEAGTSNGTITDLEGNYTLKVSNEDAILEFSFIGYLPESIKVNGNRKIDVVLNEDVLELDEIVVVGYGTQKKSDVSTAITSVDNEALVRSSKTSFDQALQGKMAGVHVTTNSGQPGGMTSVNIRGVGGLGPNEPLYVVDGVILYDYQNNIHEGRLDYGTNVTNVLSSINPADIESIDVLKDASATALYGSRGGNGVVIITTKRGKEGMARISFNTKYGVQTLANKLDLLNAAEYAQFSNDARMASEMLPYPNWPEDPAILGEGTDYQDKIFSPAPYQDYSLSVSGGNNGSNYYISGSYTSQEGIIRNTGFDRISLKVNNDNQLNKWFKLGTSILASQTDNQLVPGNIVNRAITRSPTLPVYTADGLNYAGPGVFESSYTGRIDNPVLMSELYQRQTVNRNILGNLYAEISFLKGFTLKTSVGTDYLIAQNSLFNATYVEVPSDTAQQPANLNTVANAEVSNVSKLNLLVENTLSYVKTFGKHSINSVVGYTAQKFETDILEGESFNHPSNFLTTIDAGSSTDRYAGGRKTVKTYTSVLGAVRYNYNRKYYFTANIRRDGSSVFPTNHKFGIFPSFSLAWRLTGEKFMEPLEAVVSDLKIRGSWGQTGIDGNLQQNPEYALLGMRYNAVFNNTVHQGIAPASVINPDLHWETATQTDVGIDLGLFGNKFTLVADYFYKLQEDIITNTIVPRLSGITNGYYTNPVSQAVNSAEAVNKGYELAVSYKEYRTRLKYSFGVNFSRYQNKITKLDEPIFMLSYNGGHLVRIEEGHPISQFYGYLTDGLFTSQEELDALNASSSRGYYQNVDTRLGDVKFKDIGSNDTTGVRLSEPDGYIDESDRSYIGSPIPDFVFGFNFSLEYESFDLSAAFSGVYGNELYNANRVYLEASSDQRNKMATMLDRWSVDNPDGALPRAVTSDLNLNSRNSDRFIEDGSYLKLKSIELGYSLPRDLIDRIGISELRVFLSATNVFTLTNYSGYDPDVGKYLLNDDSGLISGFDNSFYPQARTFMAGLNLNF
jgi:TonB-linked SusC/RagA family outer membrane protein